MTHEEYRAAMEDVICLARCAVNEEIPPEERVKGMDLRRLYAAADRHMMTSITAMALQSAGVRDEAFVQAEAKAIRKNAALEAELRRLASRLEQAGIWYMPLKGAVLKDYYPRFGMRQMSDYDILFDPDRSRDVREIMESMGYTVKDFGKDHHDLYSKPPMYVIEMHRKLFDLPRNAAYIYYENVKERLIPDEKEPYRFHFSLEDFYVYMLAHEHKHYSAAGTGLRSNLDIYVFWKRFGDTLDRNYIAGELEKLSLTEFEQQSRELAMSLFGGGELTEEAREILENHLLSGTYGSEEHRVAYGSRQTGGRLGYALRRLFLSREMIQFHYPLFWRYKVLLPFLPLYRLFRGMALDGTRVRSELRAVFRPGRGK